MRIRDISCLLFSLNTLGLSEAYITPSSCSMFHRTKWTKVEWMNEQKKWNLYEFNLISNVNLPKCEMWSLKMQRGREVEKPANHFWITIRDTYWCFCGRWHFFKLLSSQLPYFHMRGNKHMIIRWFLAHRSAIGANTLESSTYFVIFALKLLNRFLFSAQKKCVTRNTTL